MSSYLPSQFKSMIFQIFTCRRRFREALSRWYNQFKLFLNFARAAVTHLFGTSNFICSRTHPPLLFSGLGPLFRLFILLFSRPILLNLTRGAWRLRQRIIHEPYSTFRCTWKRINRQDPRHVPLKTSKTYPFHDLSCQHLDIFLIANMMTNFGFYIIAQLTVTPVPVA